MAPRITEMMGEQTAPFRNEEEQAFLQSLATEMIAMLDDAEKALAQKIVEQRFDQDEYLALWGLLPAKVRTAIKRGSQ